MLVELDSPHTQVQAVGNPFFWLAIRKQQANGTLTVRKRQNFRRDSDFRSAFANYSLAQIHHKESAGIRNAAAKRGSANENRNAAAILADNFCLIRRTLSLGLGFLERLSVENLVFGRRQIAQQNFARIHLLSRIANQSQQRFVRSSETASYSPTSHGENI